MSRKKVLVVGETCLDEFIYCQTQRLCPEGPVPVLQPISCTTNNGMSGNVVNNLKSINPNLSILHIHQPNQIKKTRYVDKKSNHLFIRVDVGDGEVSPYNANHFPQIMDFEFDLVIVSDYDKGFLSNRDLISLASLSSLTILDTKKILTDDVVSNFSFVKLNEHEALQNKHIQLTDRLVITLGSRGAQHGDTVYASIDPQETIDVSGAGDTFTAAFAIRYLETKCVDTSIKFANTMAATVVRKRGVATP